MPSDSKRKPWKWRYSLERVIRGSAQTTLAQGATSASDTTVRIKRNPQLTEWYTNKPEGIEQGFEIATPPHANARGELVLRATVATDLVLTQAVEDAIVFSRDGVETLRYAGLKVSDARGKVIPARLSFVRRARGGVLDIRISDADAFYPLSVDPVASSASWTGESNQASAYYGRSLGIAGDVNGDGYSDVIVGADWFDNGETNEGQAYLYMGSSSGLGTTAAWTGESNQANAYYGDTVNTAGDVNGDGYSDVVVSASQYSNGENYEGRVYLYLGSSSGLASIATWSGESDQVSAFYGGARTAGDVNGDGYSDVIIGATYYDNGQNNEGRAYLYYGSASGLATTAAWTGESDQASTYFGSGVGTAGDINGDGYSDVIIGAPNYSNGESTEGRSYLYLGSSSGLPTTANWTGESNQAGGAYGRRQASAGDVNGDGYSDVVVAAHNYANGQNYEGQSYLYLGSSSGLATTAAWTGESNQASGYYGSDLSSAGDTNGDGYSDVLVGAYYYDNGQGDEGQAYIYFGSASGLATTAGWTGESNRAGALFGNSVSTAGDTNGDGYSDVIVGASSYSNGQNYEGGAFVYLGSATLPATTPSWTTEPNAAIWYGTQTQALGDVNGDGYGDMGLAAPLYSSTVGAVYVFHGSSTGIPTTASWTKTGSGANEYLAYPINRHGELGGHGFCPAGDVNGDGYSDLIASQASNTMVYLGSATGLATTSAWTKTGRLYGCGVGDVNGDGYSDVFASTYDTTSVTNNKMGDLYYGSASGLLTTSAWDGGTSAFGYYGDIAGDVNGDGYGDALFTNIWCNSSGSCGANEGYAKVYHGSSNGLLTTSAWTLAGTSGNQRLGIDAASAGDVNGDGYADLLMLNAPEGKLFLGSASGLAATASWTQVGDSYGWPGYYLATAGGGGDFNSDGYSDVIITNMSAGNGQTFEGKAFLYLGSSSGASTTYTWSFESNQEDARLGWAAGAGPAGDVNGDGYNDLVMGAPVYDNGTADEGQAYLFYGNAGKGLSVIPRQFNNNSQFTQVGGRTSAGTYSVKVKARTAMGRTRARLVVEKKHWAQRSQTHLEQMERGQTSESTEQISQLLSQASLAQPATTGAHACSTSHR